MCCFIFETTYKNGVPKVFPVVYKVGVPICKNLVTGQLEHLRHQSDDFGNRCFCNKLGMGSKIWTRTNPANVGEFLYL